jgi:hypothetical protein
MMNDLKLIPLVLLTVWLSACSGDNDSPSTSQTQDKKEVNTPVSENPIANNLLYGTLTDITSDSSANPVPYITPQCYTNPISEGTVYNPCYACHTESKSPNFLNDTDVQVEFNFPEPGTVNHWENLFKDRREEVAEIADNDILNYVREDNYFSENGGIILAAKLANPPQEWDRNKNGQWDGYVPDIYFNFDHHGFDQAPNGSYTGWRAFAYYPFLGTFMPTNGSTDDVMIRLPKAFQELENGQFDKETYMVNLAIVEAMMKKKNISILPTDEKRFNVDLNKNGVIDTATFIKYDWAPLEHRHMSYVGEAKKELENGKIHIAAGLMPEGTEFVHSVRYLDVYGDHSKMATRMKELRYSRKNGWRNYFQLRTIVDKEIKERHDYPDRTKVVTGNMESGLHVPHGWTYQGFIEDDAGELRPQSYEETYFCIGCHGYTGSSNDTVISFHRKFDASTHQQGWYHWMQKSFANIPDPKREDGRGEYEYYLEQNPTGNEYRTNNEVLNKFFNDDGSKKQQAFDTLKNDISYLMMPSKERALLLNKAYKVIVDEQSFTKGREGIIEPLNNVHKSVEVNQETGIREVLSYY